MLQTILEISHLPKPTLTLPMRKKNSSKVLDLSHLHVFCCEAYVSIAKEDKESKLSPRTIKCIFVGYDHQSKAFRCFNPIVKKKFITKNIHFNENMLNPTNKTKIDRLNHIENIAI
jgi:hypothetical protein